jgi:Zn-finger nucleic acid-binding protein
MPRSKDLLCPRDRTLTTETVMGDAKVDVCGKCRGIFFDSGEMFAASGIAADPSSWDRPETGGVVKEGTLRCPRCEHVVMQAQDVTLDDKHVEIDRCGKCGGIWLDDDELDTIVAIGHAMRPILDAARASAQAALAEMGPVDFRPPPKRWKLALALALLCVAGGVAYKIYQDNYSPAAKRAEERWRRDSLEGCPCGCDRSAKMVADLKKEGSGDALRGIERSLVTIGERENVGYVTERMVQHRLRLLDLAGEMPESAYPETRRLMASHKRAQVERCKVAPVEDDAVRVCAELVVHGERIELVDGADKLITPCFRLWLEIENLGPEARTLAPPAIDGGPIHLPVSRWYEEGGRGEPWDGVVRAGEKVRVNVIGYIPEHVPPRTAIRADVALGSLVIPASTEARAVIELEPIR